MMYKRGMSFEEARRRLFELIGGQGNEIMLQNANDGDKARLNGKSIKKMTSGTAIRKSVENGFTKEQHFAAVSDIDTLYRNAVKVLSHPDKYGNPEVVIHRFAAPLHVNDAIAYITVKESILHGKRVYSAELMKIKKLGGILTDSEVFSRILSSPSFQDLSESPGGRPSQGGAIGLDTEKAFRTHQDSIINVIQEALKVNSQDEKKSKSLKSKSKNNKNNNKEGTRPLRGLP